MPTDESRRLAEWWYAKVTRGVRNMTKKVSCLLPVLEPGA
jgi:hypothetical protein